ncbi:MAG: class F sortase [Kibdelosporangium sp.]
MVLVLTLTLSACSGEQATPQIQQAATAPAETSSRPDATTLPASPPTEISIPRIKAKSTLIALGLNADETVQVPPVTQPMQAGWYDKAPTPGEIGPAVILGHVDGNHQPGIFYRLKEMVRGDEILVSRKDGRTAHFVVDRVEQVSKKKFPTDQVYGDTTKPELRLITCGGTFDHSVKSYEDNIIVFASLTQTTE